MSAPTMVTERAATLREREAYVVGWFRECLFDDAFGEDLRAAKSHAARRYALPTVTRPREVQDTTGVRWRLRGARRDSHVIEYAERSTPDCWVNVLAARVGSPGMTVERARIIADLAVNPTETVEDAA